MLKIIIFLAIIIGIASCAIIKKKNIIDTERKLSAAGFTVQYANTDKKLNDLKTMEQHKIVLENKNSGSFNYIFNDAEFCKCSYNGTEEAYQNYLSLIAQKNSEEMNEYEDDAQYMRSWILNGRGC